MSTETNQTRATMLILSIALLAPSWVFCQTPPKESTGVIIDTVAEFSSEQGKDGWHYGYWNRSTDSDGRYNPSLDFKLLEHFGKDLRNGLGGHDAFSTGDLWYLEDGRLYTSLWAKGGHANSAVRLGDHSAAEQWAVRRWISDASGVVTIGGHAGKVMPWGLNWSGECKAIIVVNGETVFSTVMDEQGLDYAVAVKVQEKSVVDFMIAPYPSIGVVTFTAVLQHRPKNP